MTETSTRASSKPRTNFPPQCASGSAKGGNSGLITRTLTQRSHLRLTFQMRFGLEDRTLNLVQRAYRRQSSQFAGTLAAVQAGSRIGNPDHRIKIRIQRPNFFTFLQRHELTEPVFPSPGDVTKGPLTIRDSSCRAAQELAGRVHGDMQNRTETFQKQTESGMQQKFLFIRRIKPNRMGTAGGMHFAGVYRVNPYLHQYFPNHPEFTDQCQLGQQPNIIQSV